MNEYKILVCEDLRSHREDIQLMVGNLFKKHADVMLHITPVGFGEVTSELEKPYDLLILDLFDKEAETEKNAGVRVLMRNNGINQIPTVVYTSTGDALGFDEDEMREKYPFLLKKITKKSGSFDNLLSFVKGYFISKIGDHKHYQLYDENDLLLNLSINLIGEENFSYILYQMYEEMGRQTLRVYPMTAGLSGAVLFRIHCDHLRLILKVSKNMAALKKEHENALQLYREFPNHLINNVESKSYESFDKSVLGLVIRNVDDADTFFDLLQNPTSTKQDVESFLRLLYLEENALKDHFARDRKELRDWTAIFDSIDDWKLRKVEASLAEVGCMVSHYYGKIQPDDFRRLAVDNNYETLSVHKLLGDRYKKGLVLSHGDFHAKNVLVQSRHRPVLIDTGLIGYKHWSLDPCRLIAHIFIQGIDWGRIRYFEPDSIEDGLVMADQLIDLKAIPEDGVNNTVIAALNWLTGNLASIYGDLFTVFEFQLGLMKECLQASYRFDTVPPTKRALALAIAHRCLVNATKSVQAL